MSNKLLGYVLAAAIVIAGTALLGSATAFGSALSPGVAPVTVETTPTTDAAPGVITTTQAQTDAFGRIRVGEPVTLVELKSVRDKSPLRAAEKLVGSATSTFDTNKASVLLTTTTASGDRAVRQTKARAIYQPGKSQIIEVTATLPAPKTNVRARVGLLDDNDGLYFGTNNTTIYVARRTSTSGTPVETVVDRASWNLDKLDGSGPSGVTFDFTKAAIFVIDYQWLGVGRARFGLSVNGKLYYVHQMMHAGVLDIPYLGNPNLPIRWEIENVGTTASSTTLRAICGQAASEGGWVPEGIHESASNGSTAVSAAAGATVEVLAIRIKSTRVSDSILKPDAQSILASTTSSFEWRLVLNPTGMSGGSWSSATESSVEFNTTRTGTPSGGFRIEGGYGSSQASTVSGAIMSDLWQGADVDGTSDVLSLQITNLSASPESYLAAMHWRVVR